MFFLFLVKKKKKKKQKKPQKKQNKKTNTWRELTWLKDDSVLCVAVSEYYNPSENTQDYQEFLQYLEENK